MQITPFVLPIASALASSPPPVAGFIPDFDLARAGASLPDAAGEKDGAAHFNGAKPGTLAQLLMAQGTPDAQAVPVPTPGADKSLAPGAGTASDGAAGVGKPAAQPPLLVDPAGGEEAGARPSPDIEHAVERTRLPVTLRVRKPNAMLAGQLASDPATPLPAAHVLLAAMAGMPAAAAVAQNPAPQAPGALKPAAMFTIGAVVQPGGARGAATAVTADAAAGPDALGGDAASTALTSPKPGAITEAAVDSAAAGPGQGQRPDTGAGVLPQPAPAAVSPQPAQRHAEASPPAHDGAIVARAGHFGEALGVEIARRVETGGESFRVRLKPAELGHVEVTLAFDDRGSLRATVRTESAHALELLRQDAPDLARTLEQAGVRADAQSLRFENRGGGASGGHDQPQQHRNANHPDFAAEDDAVPGSPAWRMMRGDGQVDLLA